MDQTKYTKSRFIKLEHEIFECLICSCVSYKPMECSQCGSIFCSSCICSWFTKNKICPNRCTGQIILITSKAFLKIYKNLLIKCSHYTFCQTIIKLSDLQKHEQACLLKIKNNVEEYRMKASLTYDVPKQKKQSKKKQKDQTLKKQKLKWNKTFVEQGTVVYDNNTRVWIEDNIVGFRTVISDKPLMYGINYWEIIKDDKTQSYFQIGIKTSQLINYSKCMICLSKKNWDVAFSKSNKVGVYLNMYKGIILYTFGNQYSGIRFQSETLLDGQIYVMVSLLSRSGCQIIGPLPCPQFLLNLQNI